VSLWSRGAIAGSFWAGHDIGSIMGYDSITSALIHAINRIESIDCWRNVTGSIGAGTIGRIVAGGQIGAQISGSVGYRSEQDHWVYGRYLQVTQSAPVPRSASPRNNAEFSAQRPARHILTRQEKGPPAPGMWADQAGVRHTGAG
jgi:hypothetical protein